MPMQLGADLAEGRWSMDVVDVWTGRRASALRAALRMSNESFAGHLGAAVRTVAQWDAKPDTVLSPTMQAVLDRAFEQASESARSRLALLCDATATVLAGPTGHAVPQLAAGAVDITGSARESASDAALRVARISDAVDSIRNQLIATARRYSHRPPISVFADAREVRNLAYRLAERTHRPSELVDLYVVAGDANALMSSIAFDLGHWDAARTLAESGTSYADLAGHASLEAWTWGLQATLANWRQDIAAATAAFERGMAVAPEGAPRFRLRYIAARTMSAAADRTAVERLITAGQLDRKAAHGARDEFAHEIGGEFAFDDARAAACEAAAWLQLAQGERAEAEASHALQLYSDLQASARPFSPVNGLRIDVSAARVLRRDLDGARDALRPVLELEPARRNAALAGRMTAVKARLSSPEWTRTPSAIDLVEEIHTWASATAAGHQNVDNVS